MKKHYLLCFKRSVPDSEQVNLYQQHLRHCVCFFRQKSLLQNCTCAGNERRRVLVQTYLAFLYNLIILQLYTFVLQQLNHISFSLDLNKGYSSLLRHSTSCLLLLCCVCQMDSLPPPSCFSTWISKGLLAKCMYCSAPFLQPLIDKCSAGLAHHIGNVKFISWLQ